MAPFKYPALKCKLTVVHLLPEPVAKYSIDGGKVFKSDRGLVEYCQRASKTLWLIYRLLVQTFSTLLDGIWQMQNYSGGSAFQRRSTFGKANNCGGACNAGSAAGARSRW
jgi:hypothetical protein